MSSTTPIESLASLRIGTVEYVSPDEFKILLDTDTPDNIALNTGLPRPFPRINGYLLIPIDQGFVVGQITWITIERSNFPVRKGFKDFGLIVNYVLIQLVLFLIIKNLSLHEESSVFLLLEILFYYLQMNN